MVHVIKANLVLMDKFEWPQEEREIIKPFLVKKTGLVQADKWYVKSVNADNTI